MNESLSHLVGKHVSHIHAAPETHHNGKWTYSIERRNVVLLALSGKWAMVRRPGCMPYVCEVKELSIVKE